MSNEAQRRRIAMEHLCANISTADLENAQSTQHKTLTVYGQACKDRDALLAACMLVDQAEGAAEDRHDYDMKMELALDAVRAAIEGVGK